MLQQFLDKAHKVSLHSQAQCSALLGRLVDLDKRVIQQCFEYPHILCFDGQHETGPALHSLHVGVGSLYQQKLHQFDLSVKSGAVKHSPATVTQLAQQVLDPLLEIVQVLHELSLGRLFP